MPLTVVDNGRGNRISIPAAVRQFHGNVVLAGNDSFLEIGEGCRWVSLRMDLGSNCHVSIGRGCSLGELAIYCATDALTSIGNGCSINGSARLMCHEPASLTLGAGCLLAGFVDILTSDMHSIVDLATGARLNPAQDIVLGDRVWVPSARRS